MITGTSCCTLYIEFKFLFTQYILSYRSKGTSYKTYFIAEFHDFLPSNLYDVDKYLKIHLNLLNFRMFYSTQITTKITAPGLHYDTARIQSVRDAACRVNKSSELQ